MGVYRRRFLIREKSEFDAADPQLAKLVIAYEAELRAMGLIDFDDMPLLAVRALATKPWLRKALVAKYPILAVDEYQDLGRALHGIVMGLCFSAGMRLFAVGDVDQSIYGFTGANPELLRIFVRSSGRRDGRGSGLTIAAARKLSPRPNTRWVRSEAIARPKTRTKERYTSIHVLAAMQVRPTI